MALPQREATIEAVESIIQYKFTNSALLWEALHTSSLIIGGQTNPVGGNKRLAIVGDAVLRLGLAEDWYQGDTSAGHFEMRHSSAIGRNSNLDMKGRALGLERFVSGAGIQKAVADTVEAILGAVYLDSSLAKAKDVMDALDLVPRERRMERELEVEGLVLLDPPVAELRRPPKRRASTAGQECGPLQEFRPPKRPRRNDIDEDLVSRHHGPKTKDVIQPTEFLHEGPVEEQPSARYLGSEAGKEQGPTMRPSPKTRKETKQERAGRQHTCEKHLGENARHNDPTDPCVACILSPILSLSGTSSNPPEAISKAPQEFGNTSSILDLG